MHKEIYMDYNATTPVDSRVSAVMLPYFETFYGNPASVLHEKGRNAKVAAEKARAQVAQLIGASPSEIAFTGGATESNNWALKGLVDSLLDQRPEEIPHILTSNIEHASVREPLEHLNRRKLAQVDFLPVDRTGLISVEQLEKARKTNTRILSLIWVHNEIGTIQDMRAIAEWAQSHGIILHTDATQAVGKMKVDLREIPISLLSFSGHKIYGPKGIGALFIRGRDSLDLNGAVDSQAASLVDMRLSPLLHGGGQESLGRSGTLNIPGIVGLGEACKIAQIEMQVDADRLGNLSREFWSNLKKDFPLIRLNGADFAVRAPNNLNITFVGVQGSRLLPLISGLCVSAGSACSSGQVQGSSVLRAIGHSESDDSVTFRFSAGRMSTREDFAEALEVISKALKSLDFNAPSEAIPTAPRLC